MNTGDMFGQDYRLLGLLGRGGMGEVHRAQDLRHDRVVALKLLPEELATDRTYQERFRREARAASRLSQPHIVPIHRHGDVDGRLYIDMALVEGPDLGTLIARHGPLAPARAVDIVGQVASALDAAHAIDLVHRDVKPSNVLLTRSAGEQSRDFAYLTDFGIARDRGEFASTSMTQAGSAVGTVAYMAPERWSNRDVDGRADVYSLACVLHECLTGRAPFPGEDTGAVIDAHRHAPPPRPSFAVAGLPPGLDGVIAQGLAKDPEQRFRTAGALAAAAQASLVQDTMHRSGGYPIPPQSGPHPVPRGPSPWRTRLLVAAAVVVTVLVTVGVLRVVDLVDGGGLPAAAAAPDTSATAAPSASVSPTSRPPTSASSSPPTTAGQESGDPLSDPLASGPPPDPRWTGQFRITEDGYDLDANPEELGNRGPDIRYVPDDKLLSSNDNYTEVAFWIGQTQPTAAECTRAVATQPLSDNEQSAMPIDVGSAMCISTGEHLSFVRVIGDPQGEGLPAEYAIWQRAR